MIRCLQGLTAAQTLIAPQVTDDTCFEYMHAWYIQPQVHRSFCLAWVHGSGMLDPNQQPVALLILENQRIEDAEELHVLHAAEAEVEVWWLGQGQQTCTGKMITAVLHLGKIRVRVPEVRLIHRFGELKFLLVVPQLFSQRKPMLLPEFFEGLHDCLSPASGRSLHLGVHVDCALFPASS